MNRIFQFFQHKGFFFWLNLSIVILGACAVLPFLDHQSGDPFLIGYSAQYVLYLAALWFPLICLLVLILVAGTQINKLTLLSLLAVFVLAEFSLRLFYPEAHYVRDIFRYPKPYVMFTGKPNAEAAESRIRLNKLGLRIEREMPKHKPKNEIRVFVLGGSTVFNGTPLSNSIPGRIQSLFHKDRLTQVKVYNAGVVSYVSGQELSLLLHTLTDYNPDLVIVYDGGNDVFTPYNYDPRPGYPLNFIVYEEGFDLIGGKDVRLSQYLSLILYKSRTIRILIGRSLRENLVSLAQHRRQSGYRSDNWEEEIVDEYINNLKKMCGIAKGFDFKIMAILQPLIYFKRPLVGDEHRLVVMSGEKSRAYVGKQYDRIREHFRSLEKQHLKDGRCYFLDLSDAMDGYQEEAYLDFIHTNDLGNEFLASRIYSHIKEVLPGI